MHRSFSRSLTLFTCMIFAANGAVVLAIPLLGDYMLPDRFYDQRMALLADPIMNFVSFALPFPTVAALFSIFVVPPLVRFFRADNPALLPAQIKRRLANLPLSSSLIGAAGWIAGLVFTAIGAAIRGIALPGELLFFVGLQLCTQAGLIFVPSYYGAEFLVRRYLMPVLYPGDELIRETSIVTPRLRARILILYFSTVILPLVVVFALLLKLNDGGRNVFERDLGPELVLMAACIAGVTLLITLQKAAALGAPLRMMQAAAVRIEAGDYRTRVQVQSADEFGELAARINKMSAGLEERERMRDTFGRVVDPAVRDHLLSGELRLGGERRNVTVLFSDLEGFTHFAERRSPEEVVRLLNTYFERMTDCIRAYGGVVNKYVGDAVVAVFGAPQPLPGHAERAVRAALAMHAAERELNRELPEYDFRTRIGIHTGDVLAGNIGSQQRLEYTVIGDTVNTAARLESAGKKLGERLIVSAAAVHSANLQSSETTRSLGRILVKGKQEPLAVFTVDAVQKASGDLLEVQS